MKRVRVNQLENFIGGEVTLKGWTHGWRELKGWSFLILRESSGLCQIVVPKEVCGSISPESVVEVVGVVNRESQSKYGGIEVVASKVQIISAAETLPFPINREVGLPPFNTLNIYRPLTLRKLRERSIFKIQSEVVWAFREFLRGQGFTEIQSTKLSASGLEGGSEIFGVEYFGEEMSLTQSPQFYKQMMVGVYERVFEIGKVYRAEGSNSNRHLTEFIGLDLEMGFIESVEEVMEVEEGLFEFIFNHLNKVSRSELETLGVGELVLNPIPRITYNRAVEILGECGLNWCGVGLNSEAERVIGSWVQKNLGSEFVFITKYPISERPFYAMPSLEPGSSETFELLYKGVEITSGGARIHNYGQLVESIKGKGLNPEKFESYLMPFKWGMPPHGGLGIGLERILKQMLNLPSAEEASLIPRTREKFIH